MCHQPDVDIRMIQVNPHLPRPRPENTEMPNKHAGLPVPIYYALVIVLICAGGHLSSRCRSGSVRRVHRAQIALPPAIAIRPVINKKGDKITAVRGEPAVEVQYLQTKH